MRRTGVMAGIVAGLLFAAAPAAAQDAPTKYSLAGGCHSLAPVGGGDEVGKFRMQATALGRYLLYDSERRFLAATSSGTTRAAQPSNASDWKIDEAEGGTFTLAPLDGRQLGGSGARFTFTKADGCPVYPEVDVSAAGTPRRGDTAYEEVRGTVDAHMHMMAYEFLGGRVHCGRPWHRFGAPFALTDCPDHTVGMGAGAVLENVLFGNPVRTHDPVGWPTFKDWPHHKSLTHEQSYYRWLERAWMGGLRVFTNLFVENGALCELYPLKQNDCNEMNSVRLQVRRIRELEDYIDAQAGGPGKGFFRIVTDPFQARKVINEGKLAVIMGIEISQLFDCKLRNDRPLCDKDKIDRDLDEVYGYGVRQMELINKFDNALGGVAGDGGAFGVAINAANAQQTGQFWKMGHCDGHSHDNPQVTGHESIEQIGATALVPQGAAPVYGAPPHCNQRGLSPLGEHVVRRMMERKMIIDPDHLSVVARNQLLSVVEAERYSGIVSSHSWSTDDAYPRIYKLGGVITPYAGGSTGFVKEWRKLKGQRDDRFRFGFGYGADMNGFGSQGGPRGDAASNPVTYPFKSIDGGVTFSKQRSGEREFDINADGVAHYGLYPDWMEDLRKLAGDEIIDDMSRGAEAFLEMWERAEGVPAPRCRPRHEGLTSRGIGRARVGMSATAVLKSVGQPLDRSGPGWSYCVRGTRNRNAKVSTTFTPSGKVGLVSSTARDHLASGVRTGSNASRLRGKASSFGPGLRVRNLSGGRRFVYGVKRGRVSFVAVASREASRTPGALRVHLRAAGVR